jgi:hypothetical protein
MTMMSFTLANASSVMIDLLKSFLLHVDTESCADETARRFSSYQRRSVAVLWTRKRYACLQFIRHVHPSLISLPHPLQIESFVVKVYH